VEKYGQKTILMTMVQHLALHYHYQVKKCHDSIHTNANGLV
jgi:hypothetical protein